MKSVRKALRAGEIEKDTYDRLVCARCGKNLKTRDPTDEVWSVRVCPECGSEWKQI